MSLQFADLPRPLREDVREGRVLPFVGSGFSLNADLASGQMPTWAELARNLAEDLTLLPQDEPTDVVDTISNYEQEHGRLHLTARLLELLHHGKAIPGRPHQALVRVPFEHVLTTNFDLLIDDAFRRAGISYYPVVEETQLAIGSAGHSRVLIKVHGDIHHPDRMVLTEDDFDTWIRRNPLLATEVASLFVRKTGLLVGYSLSDPDLRQVLGLLKERLGPMRRPLYALVPRARASDVQRFERRGVRLLQLLSPGERDIGAAFAALFDEMASEMRATSVAELSAKRAVVSDLLTRAPNIAPLVFVSVASDRLRPYEDYVYTVVEKLGLMPFSSHQVPPGSDLIATIEGMIERSVAVIAEPKDESTQSEYATAVSMEKQVLLLTGRLNRARAVAEGFFTRQSTNLIHEYPVPSSEDEWVELSQWLEGWLREAINASGLATNSEPQRLLDLGEYRASVLAAYALLESRLRLHLSKLVRSQRMIGVRDLLDIALENGLLAEPNYSEALNFMGLRNEVAHTDRPVTRREARNVVSAVMGAVNELGFTG